MSDIDPIAIAVIATASTEHLPVRNYIQQERRFRESLREYPPHEVLDIPFCRRWHAEFYLSDPYLDVTFEEPGGWCNGRFMHEPLGLGSQYRDSEDYLVLRLEGAMGGATRHRCSPALLKAIKRVLYEPDTYDDIGRQHAESLARSRRDTLLNLQASVYSGWTHAEYRHFVQTGEQPPDKPL